MNDLPIGLLGALVATNQPLAVSNLVQQNTGVSVSIPNPNDPAEKELQQLMVDDDAALAEVDQWIRTTTRSRQQGAGESKEALNPRIMRPARILSAPITPAFSQRHPDSARGYLAYGSFLNDIGDEEAAMPIRKRPPTRSRKIRRRGTTSPITTANTAR